jgi:hypothetical protein
MQTETAKPTETTEPQTQGCRCQAQIAEILARLEKVERDALTVEKLTDLQGRSSIISSLPQRP